MFFLERNTYINYYADIWCNLFFQFYPHVRELIFDHIFTWKIIRSYKDFIYNRKAGLCLGPFVIFQDENFFYDISLVSEHIDSKMSLVVIQYEKDENLNRVMLQKINIPFPYSLKVSHIGKNSLELKTIITDLLREHNIKTETKVPMREQEDILYNYIKHYETS